MLSNDHHLEFQNIWVRFIPQSMSHVKEGLLLLGKESIWQWNGSTGSDKEALTSYIKKASEGLNSGIHYPFRNDLQKEKMVGSTSFDFMSKWPQQGESGWIYFRNEFQLSTSNWNVQFVTLSSSFNPRYFEQIEFKTELINEPSRNTLKDIGTMGEGVLRSHVINQLSRKRNTIDSPIQTTERSQTKAIIFKNFAPLEST